MKITLADIDKRLFISPIRTEGILSYDIDNAYPQRMMRLTSGSGTAKRCIELYAKFLSAKGFKDKNLYSTICNRSKDTADKILRKAVKDYCNFGGMALHFNYNLLYQKTEISVIPFEYCRLPDPENPLYENKIVVYEDWGRDKWRNFKREKIKFIYTYNPDPKIIEEQILEVGGIQNYEGQILWISNEGASYPLPIYDCAIEDIDTDIAIKTTRNSQVRTEFTASHIFVDIGKSENDDERQEKVNKIAEFQGPEYAGSIMHLEVDSKEQVPQLIEVKSQLNERVIQVTNNAIKTSIIEVFGIPPILLGIENIGGGLTFSNDVIRLASDYYNMVTEPDRIYLEEIFTKIFKDFPATSMITDFSIEKLSNLDKDGVATELLPDMTKNERREKLLGLPVEEDIQSDKPLLAATLGVGGTQALTAILIDPVLSSGQKIKTLQILFQLSKEDATEMVTGTTITSTNV